ncbi:MULTISPECIES: hypothetical protein [unclassified Bartonella]|uniref:hypothetical protein n=1 Tax=unclassified Bartonella TaxID=2645622 RepID=UPI0035CFE961
MGVVCTKFSYVGGALCWSICFRSYFGWKIVPSFWMDWIMLFIGDQDVGEQFVVRCLY